MTHEPSSHAEHTRTRLRLSTWVVDLRQDARQALRLLRRNPAFAATAILTLALGIGGCTAIWSLLYGVLLRPLPYPEPDRVVAIREGQPLSNAAGRPSSGITNSRTVERWRRDGSTLEAIAAYRLPSYTLSGSGDPARIDAASVSPALFSILRVTPALGRFFHPLEETAGNERVVVLGHHMWRDRFGARGDIVGTMVVLDGVEYEVVGVAPEGFTFPGPQVEMWTPFVLSPPGLAPNEFFVLFGVARLHPGVALAAAQAEGNTIVTNLAREWSAGGTRVDPNVLRLAPLRHDLTAEVGTGLKLLMTAVACVLVLGCANLVNLLLARDTERTREMAIRRALGASGSRLARLALVEIAILTAAGGAAGAAFAFAFVRLLRGLAPADLPRLADVRLDGPVLLFAIAASVVSGALVGLAPAWRNSRPPAADSLLASTRLASAPPIGARLRLGRNAIAVAEIAVAVALLAGAALVIQSLIALLRVDLGYRPGGVLSASLHLPATSYPDRLQVRARLDAMLEQLDETPQVEAAGVVTFLPLTDGWGYYRYPIEGRPPETDSEHWVVARPQPVSAGYLEAMGLRLAAGRWLDRGDRAGSTPVVVVNEEFVRRFLANENPLANRLMVGDRATAIVGVVSDVRQAGARDAPFPEIYLPFQQIAIVPEQVSLVIRTVGDPGALLPALREIVRGVDAGLPLADVATMEDRLAVSVGQPRFYSRTLGLFAGVALCLAATGVYGVLAFEISRRRRELGIRRALGASQREIVLMVLRRGSCLVAIGLAAGMAAAVSISRTFASLLFGIGPAHLPTLSAVAAIVGTVALLACYLPARRAARAEPAEVLRSE